ncbi:MAG: hypothetical protein WDZ66_12165 [Steroidobacteraceae bacterium]
MRRPVDQFMRELTEIADYRGKPFGRANLLFRAEDEHSQEIAKRFKGYLVLSDAFKCFYLESVEVMNTQARPKVKEQVSEFYGLLIPRLSNAFLALCGAERIAIKGYPYQGYTVLRNVYDNLVLTSAALQRITDFYSIEGVRPEQVEYDPAAARKLRKAAEFAVRRQMTGDQSGLSPETRTEIDIWDSLFDLETHGGRLSATNSMEWLRGQGTLSVVPRFEERGWVMYMNRFMEIAWMLHRLMPNIQPPAIPFEEPWPKKWKILDQSFSETVSALTEQRGKPIGDALVELVERKFPFHPELQFPL